MCLRKVKIFLFQINHCSKIFQNTLEKLKAIINTPLLKTNSLTKLNNYSIL